MLLAKPNPQNYYSVTVALYRPNLLIELKRFLFISFSLCSCLLSLLFSYSLFFVFPFFLFSCFVSFFFFLFLSFFCAVAQPLSRHVRTKAGFVLLFELNEKVFLLYLCFSPIFMLVQCRFFMRNVAVDASASCCLYIIMWGAEKFG